jgi:hypothetical protein
MLTPVWLTVERSQVAQRAGGSECPIRVMSRRHVCVMSVIPLKADIHHRGLHVRLVP